MANELLPCPFCGSTDVEVIDEWGYHAQCGTCGASSVGALSEEGAVSAWNRRTPSPERTEP